MGQEFTNPFFRKPQLGAVQSWVLPTSKKSSPEVTWLVVPEDQLAASHWAACLLTLLPHYPHNHLEAREGASPSGTAQMGSIIITRRTRLQGLEVSMVCVQPHPADPEEGGRCRRQSRKFISLIWHDFKEGCWVVKQ